jgi:uncharacterized membrane protein YuzA (DUF378 family)
MEYLSQIICAIIGFLAGVTVTLSVQKVKKSQRSNQSGSIVSGDQAGRDITKHG